MSDEERRANAYANKRWGRPPSEKWHLCYAAYLAGAREQREADAKRIEEVVSREMSTDSFKDQAARLASKVFTAAIRGGAAREGSG